MFTKIYLSIILISIMLILIKLALMPKFPRYQGYTPKSESQLPKPTKYPPIVNQQLQLSTILEHYVKKIYSSLSIYVKQILILLYCQK